MKKNKHLYLCAASLFLGMITLLAGCNRNEIVVDLGEIEIAEVPSQVENDYLSEDEYDNNDNYSEYLYDAEDTANQQSYEDEYDEEIAYNEEENYEEGNTEDEDQGSNVEWYDIFIVPDNEHWSKAMQGAYLVKNNVGYARDGYCYSLNQYGGSNIYDVYGMGFRDVKRNIVQTYLVNKYVPGSLGSLNISIVCSLFNSDVPVYNNGDVLKSYGNTTLFFTKVEPIGYGIPVMDQDGYYCILDRDTSNLVYVDVAHKATSKVEQFSIAKDDVALDDYENQFYNLEKDGEYTVSWFEGTDYFEYILKADCRTYKLTEDKTEIEGKLEKEGYASYDVSSLSKGFYYVTGSFMENINGVNGMVEIQ